MELLDNLILTHSPDFKISKTRIEGVNGKENIRPAEITLTAAFSHGIHFDYILQALRDGVARFDTRSRLARFKYEFDPDHESYTTDASSRTISVRGKIYPWSQEYIPRDGSWEDLLLHQGLKVGKLIAVYPEHIVPREKLEYKIRKEESIRLREGSIVTDNGILLSLDRERYVPNEKVMTLRQLWDALNDKPRDALTGWQLRQDTDSIIVDKKNGVITHSHLRPHEYGLVIRQEQGKGISHSNAFYVLPSSTHNLFVELRGNGHTDQVITHILADFIEPYEARVERMYSIPSAKLQPDEAGINTKVHDKSRYFFIGGENRGQFIRLHKATTEDVKSLRELEAILRNSKPGTAFYTHTFPSLEMLDIIQSTALLYGTVGSLIFNEPPIAGEAFNAFHFHYIQTMWKRGINVIWDSEHFSRLHFYDLAFMRDTMRVRFDRGRSSNSIMTLFGSRFDLEGDDLTRLERTCQGWKQYTGGDNGYGIIASGGGPGAMTQFMVVAADHGLGTGSINVLKRGEPQGAHSIKVDFYFPFEDMQLNIRQGNLVSPSKTFGVFPGGVGTGSELFEVLAKQGFFNLRDAVYVMGASDYIRPWKELLYSLAHPSRGPARFSQDTHDRLKYLTKGEDLLPWLKEYHKFGIPKFT